MLARPLPSPAEHRAAGLSGSVGVQWFANAIVSLLFPIALNKMGEARVLLFFAAMCGACFVFTDKYVPETKGRNIDGVGGGARKEK